MGKMTSKATVFTLASVLCLFNILLYVLYLSPTVQLNYNSDLVTLPDTNSSASGRIRAARLLPPCTPNVESSRNSNFNQGANVSFLNSTGDGTDPDPWDIKPKIEQYSANDEKWQLEDGKNYGSLLSESKIVEHRVDETNDESMSLQFIVKKDKGIKVSSEIGTNLNEVPKNSINSDYGRLGQSSEKVKTDYRTHQTTEVPQTTFTAGKIQLTVSKDSITTSGLNISRSSRVNMTNELSTKKLSESTTSGVPSRNSSNASLLSSNNMEQATTIKSDNKTTQSVLVNKLLASINNSSTSAPTVYHPYSYVMNQPDLCSQPEDLLLMILVCTSLDHQAARSSIRETWGSIVQERTDVKLAFVMGKTDNTSIQQSIVQESYNYSDIIQEDFLDTYNNLTLKSVMLLKWADTFCINARYVMKVDDDMYINLNNLLRYLVTVKAKTRMLFGRLVKGARAIRDKKSKWYVPESEYRMKVYPDYLSGTGYVMSGDVVHSLYANAQKIPMIHLEDVYVTGIVAKKAGIPRKYHSGFTYEKRTVKGCAYKSAVSGHKLNSTEIRQIWTEITNKKIKC